MAVDNTAKSKKTGSVSTHPVFPAIVALWFAALFGIGSLILPPVLFDNIAQSMGQQGMSVTGRIAIAVTAAVLGAGLGVLLARKVANAQKPVPVRARSPMNTHEAIADKGAKRPISALEELGPEGLDQPIEAEETIHGVTSASGRRRGLAVQQEASRSEFFDHAPLPGSASSASDLPPSTDDVEDDAMLELGEFEEDAAPPTDDSAGQHDDIAHLSAPARTRDFDVSFGSGSLSVARETDFAKTERPNFMRSQPDDMQASRPFDGPRVPVTTTEDAPHDSAATSNQQTVGDAASQPRPFDAPQPQQTLGETGQTFGEAGQESEAHLAELRNKAATTPVEQPDQPVASTSSEHVEGADPAQPAAKTRFGMPQPVADTATAQADFGSPPEQAPVDEADIADFAPTDVPQEEPVSTLQTESRDIATAPLAGLGMVELVERFALSLQRHTAQAMPESTVPQGMTAAAATLSHEMPGQFSDEIAKEEDDGTAAGQDPAAMAVPAALQPLDPTAVDCDEDEHLDDLSLSFDRSPAPFSMPRPAAFDDDFYAEDQEDDEHGDGDSDEDDAGFGSLLAMKSPFGGGREFVRIDDEEDDDEDIEPVVIFPGQDARGTQAAEDAPAASPAAPARPSDPVETERALRDALAKLQKMSGAA